MTRDCLWSVARETSIKVMKLPLSVLDLAPVSSGSTPSEALRNTLELARLADRLGYARYWFAEHHNIPSVASSFLSWDL